MIRKGKGPPGLRKGIKSRIKETKENLEIHMYTYVLAGVTKPTLVIPLGGR